MIFNEENIRMASFILILGLLILWQYLKPAIDKKSSKQRFGLNLSLFILSIIALKIAFPMGIIGLLKQVNYQQISAVKLNSLPLYFELPLVLLIFDFAIYWQHRLFHIINFLWKSHRVHHCDDHMDITTALRFHPVEIIFSGCYKIFIILFLGPSVLSYMIYEIMLNGFALFTHANIYIPTKIDKALRIVFVTPLMHSPHHETSGLNINKNYGNLFSFWDRIFGTYTNDTNIKFGLDEIPKQRTQEYKTILLLPFLTKED